MNMKMLFVINDEERKLGVLINKFHLPFNTIMYGDGTASESILNFLDLKKTKKSILTSLIPDYLEKNIFDYLGNRMRMKEFGSGVAFTIPLSSSSKYVKEAFMEKEGERMENTSNYHLIITVIEEGSAEKVMNIAKKHGANGGTLLKGRSMGGKSSLRFFNMSIDPEKDILLIICDDDKRKDIMKAILDKYGVSTSSKGICFSLPIDNAIGFNE